VGLFLIESYTEGLEKAKLDYSHVDSSPLLKGNLLRMQAMFLEQLFYKEDLKANLAIAIEAVKTAIMQFEKV
jgi:hypothetical protein